MNNKHFLETKKRKKKRNISSFSTHLSNKTRQLMTPYLQKPIIIRNIPQTNSDPLRTIANCDQYSAATLALEIITEQIIAPIGDRLYSSIHQTHPNLSAKLTAMFLDQMSTEDLELLLDTPSDLQNKIAEAIAVLKHYQYLLHKQHSSITNMDKDTKYHCMPSYSPPTDNPSPYISASNDASTPMLESVSVIETESVLNSPDYASSVDSVSNNQNAKPELDSVPNNRITQPTNTCIPNNEHKNKEQTTSHNYKMPAICTMRTIRIIINAPISKSMLQLAIQNQCIANPSMDNFQQIYTRCHKSYHHKYYATVAYIHFINFSDNEYTKQMNDLFEVNRCTSTTELMISLLGNKFGILERVDMIKEYAMIRVPIEYLPKMIKICLRCKYSEAEPRQRVCRYCLCEEINDRKNIVQYYKNPKNRAIHKPHFQIEKDLKHLKIEPHLIPTLYKRECKPKNGNGKCTRKNCTFVHTKNDKSFGWKLHLIQTNANKERYAEIMSEYNLNYHTVGLQFKYRRIICSYYEKVWKYSAKTIENNASNINKIIQCLSVTHKIKLHLLPLVYKSLCREDKCRVRSGKPCSYVHTENDRIFGDMIWKIKCMAKDSFETESVHSLCDEKEGILIGNDSTNEEQKSYEWNRSPIEREWGYAIRPYREANNDEKEAEIKELSEWSINTNVSVKIEVVNKCDNVRQRIYELYIIYEEDKGAKIVPNRTFITLLFPDKYDVGLRTFPTQNSKAKKQYNKRCPACYFNVCKENEHWQLENDRMVLDPNASGNDELQGVVTQRLQTNTPNKKRYKVRIAKFGRTDSDNQNWLKFAIVASKRFNERHRNDFENVHISYDPSVMHEKIDRVLRRLDNGKMERTPISQIIFGIQKTMPTLMSDYKINKSEIKRFFAWLNDSQIDAIYGALKYNMHVIQGPPATGKSTVDGYIPNLWKRLAKDGKIGGNKVKIHGIVPTNKGCLVLAQKCLEIDRRMSKLEGMGQRLKVLYFASDTYLFCANTDEQCENIEMENLSALMNRLCVNVRAENALKRVDGHRNMNRHSRKAWTDGYIAKELRACDMIVTTFGNSTNKRLESIPFTHAICDESNQGSLDTFLGVISGKHLQYLCMAGDIQQLAPVTKSENALAKKSVYEDIIAYVTNGTNEVNTYYTRLNEQYRSHPQIYCMTSELFYGNTVVSNAEMYKRREYGRHNYGKLFPNDKLHILWHMYGHTQLDTSAMNQSKCNKIEADIAVKYIKKFIIELGNREGDLAVISDYRAQIEYVRTVLCGIPQINESEILLCTTNEIEGSSKPIVIYMCVRSNNTGNIGFLKDSKRVNVALSRAEYGQIIIGDIYTLQYNPIYNRIFDYHKRRNAIVCEDMNAAMKGQCNIKSVIPQIPVITVHKIYENKRNDIIQCSCCGQIRLEKVFCGRNCSDIVLCQLCMHRYLSKHCKTNKKLCIDYPHLIPTVTIENSQFFAVDSSGIALEFDTLLGKYLSEFDLIKHVREDHITVKLCNVAMRLCNNIGKGRQKHIPPCFRTLMEKCSDKMLTLTELETGEESGKALGIMRCKRNHLLQQNILDTRFFQIVNKIKYNNYELKQYYNASQNNKYTFYLFPEFDQYQPTTVVVAYLQSCGYSQHISNRLRARVGRGLVELNVNNPRKYNKHSVIKMDESKIAKLANELVSDQCIGIRNILAANCKCTVHIQPWSRYVILLMQNAMIEDCLGPYYRSFTHTSAIKEELSFGDKLRRAGMEFMDENELKQRGFRETPDYYLVKPWIINYNGRKVEITWLDFKNFYCSSTEWKIETLNKQARKYNKKFGTGAFVFSLGFVRPPKGLQLNSYGLLAAVPLSANYVERFIKKRMK